MLQLLILLLTVLVTSGAECPAMCICKHLPREVVPTSYLYYTAVRCDGFNSTDVTLSNLTRILEVSHLDDASFSDFVQTFLESDLPELNSLGLKHSIVSNVSGLLEAVGNQVKFLALSHNNLTVIPDLTDKLSVVSLDLSSNDLTLLPSYHSIRTLRTLETLNLSANSIRQIGPESFQNLTSLKVLDLSQNHLSSLDNRVLAPLISLQYLNLSHNQIEVLNDKCFFSLVKLQQLDVSWNNLARVAPGSLQLPSLARLLLAGNPQLGDSYEVLVGVSQKVQTVDASRTGLKQVPAALTHSIRTLKLAGNSIKSVTCGELDAYPLLQFLDFTFNDIVSIEEDAMGRLESLSILYLSDNKLQSIPRSLPEELTVLHLERNAIGKVSRDDLTGLANLEVLLLNDNKIESVEGGGFSFLHSLITLDLSRNPIKTLYPGSLTGPSALQILRLSGIDTVSPAEDVSFPLSAPDHLVSLDLSESSGLTRQLLADTAALAASRELQELDISGADLEFIRSDLLHFLPQLRVMHVKDNRLNCTNLQWLALWMRRQDQAEYRYITCASPPELWGTPLFDLQYVEIFPIKQINHERVQDFEGTINHEWKATATEKNSPLGKYVAERITHTSAPVTNNFINISVNTTSSSAPAANKDIQLESIHDVSAMASNNKNINILTDLKLFAANDITEKEKQIVKKKKEIVNSVNKILVSSADMGHLSLIPASNDREGDFTTTATKLPQEFNQPGKVWDLFNLA